MREMLYEKSMENRYGSNHSMLAAMGIFFR